MHNFSWVVPGRLAACGLSPAGGELTAGQGAFLHAEGIDALVSLTEEPLRADAVAASGLRYLHLPVPDMEAPTREQIERFVEFVDGAAEDGLATAVHCRAGLGRTGTMVACYLTHLGATARDALEQVRRLRPGSVETASQEATVRLYAGSLKVQGRQRV